ncbi:MarR family transcriptional regulator [Actibacterium pelagium]|uniref:MarR family transcriptional regulator n=2 Tax=Actibacterium pelagium TaxID=2029103 RepID=A0A917EMI4_9RHOB|nr:MarR family transcriptional regulator [Actibacterium pelagium]GGE57216.1 MarR family transcriptional regulator [Actibacterium pelagium]
MVLEGFFPYRFAVAAELFSAQLTEVYGREFGLSREEWRLLFLLQQEPEVSSIDLSRRATLSKVQISRASQKLEEKGLISRRVGDEDKRLRTYQATDQGRALFQKILPKIEARVDGVLGKLAPEDFEALDRGIRALVNSMITDSSAPMRKLTDP